MEKRAERKAHYLANKAAIKKEFKIWENIALAVWADGVTLEQLQLNQGNIARWVVETLQPESVDENNLVANPESPPAAEVTTANSKTVGSSAVDDNAAQSWEEIEKAFNKKAARSIKTLEKLELSSRPATASRAHELPAETRVPFTFRSLCNSGISYIAQIFFSPNEAEDNKGYLSPESSESSGSDREEGSSDFGDTPSSATSLSGGDGEENHIEHTDSIEKTKGGSSKAIGEGARAGAETEIRNDQLGGGIDGEDDHEDPVGGHEDDDYSSDSNLPEFEDHGGFDCYTICNLLGTGELDELRLLRLKDGFLKLLEQYWTSLQCSRVRMGNFSDDAKACTEAGGGLERWGGELRDMDTRVSPAGVTSIMRCEDCRGMEPSNEVTRDWIQHWEELESRDSQ